MDWLGSGNLPSHLPGEGFRHVSKIPEIRGHRQPQAAELVHRAHRGESGASARRIDPRYAPPLVSAIMAIVISLAVSLVETIVRLGFTSRLVPAWLSSFVVAVIVAVPTAVLVAPHAQRLVSRITRPTRRSAQAGGCPER
jgi:uncharacterized protein DUF2798